MFSPGHQFGQYKILRLIGRGGMADVYEAQMQAGLAEKRVALKLLLPDLQKDDRIVNCFIDEARLAAGLSHPNVVQVFEFGEINGRLYLSMECVDGLDLHDVLRYCHSLRRMLPVPAVLYVIHEVAFALSYIHSLKPPIIHRDVTPQNVFCSRDGHIKLGDFGVAKSAMNRSVTEVGIVKGKIAYLAPEQARGEPVCRRTDVYAAGLLLFQMLTGQNLITGDSDLELVMAAQSPKLIAPSRLIPTAAPLDRLVLSALHPQLDHRMRSAELLTGYLEQLLDKQPFDAAAMDALLRKLERSADEARIPTQLEEEQEMSRLVTMPVQLPPAATGGPVQAPREEPDRARPITRMWTGQNNAEPGARNAEPAADSTGPATDSAVTPPPKEKSELLLNAASGDKWSHSSSQLMDLNEEPSEPILLTEKAASIDEMGSAPTSAPRPRRPSRVRKKRTTGKSRVSDAQWWIMTIIVLATMGALVALTLWKG